MLSDLPETTPLTGAEVVIQNSSNGPRDRDVCATLHCCLSSLFSGHLQESETRWSSVITLCDFMWEFS